MYTVICLGFSLIIRLTKVLFSWAFYLCDLKGLVDSSFCVSVFSTTSVNCYFNGGQTSLELA